VGRTTQGALQVWDEGSGLLVHELKGFDSFTVTALTTFTLSDGHGQRPRVVAGSALGDVRVYDPEAGSMLHDLGDYYERIAGLACIDSSSPGGGGTRVVAACRIGDASVWDGETGELLTELRGRNDGLKSLAVWKDHRAGNDRIATWDLAGEVKVYDGEALELLHTLDCHARGDLLLPLQSAEGPHRLLVADESQGLQLWDPEEGRLLHGNPSASGLRVSSSHLFESGDGRYLLALTFVSLHPVDPLARHGGVDDDGNRLNVFMEVWDLGPAPPRPEARHLRPAHKTG
jgi:WD40 repeat protein